MSTANAGLDIGPLFIYSDIVTFGAAAPARSRDHAVWQPVLGDGGVAAKAERGLARTLAVEAPLDRAKETREIQRMKGGIDYA